mmetsp:Transcript_33595/g.97772  ORF Transcript_33595/g.97772 Transcript_33595/m.97772 type:complete len:250 (-) Transcript_33595:291-1040(-)
MGGWCERHVRPSRPRWLLRAAPPAACALGGAAEGARRLPTRPPPRARGPLTARRQRRLPRLARGRGPDCGPHFGGGRHEDRAGDRPRPRRRRALSEAGAPCVRHSRARRQGQYVPADFERERVLDGRRDGPRRRGLGRIQPAGVAPAQSHDSGLGEALLREERARRGLLQCPLPLDALVRRRRRRLRARRGRRRPLERLRGGRRDVPVRRPCPLRRRQGVVRGDRVPWQHPLRRRALRRRPQAAGAEGL